MGGCGWMCSVSKDRGRGPIGHSGVKGLPLLGPSLRNEATPAGPCRQKQLGHSAGASLHPRMLLSTFLMETKIHPVLHPKGETRHKKIRGRGEQMARGAQGAM